MLKTTWKAGLFIFISMLMIACQSQEEQEDPIALDDGPDQVIEVPEITEEPEQPEDVEEREEIVSADELVDGDQVVLTVNGEEVHGDRYNLIYYETKISFIQNNEEAVDLNEIKEETMNALIKQTLLAQDASEKGIVVTEAEAEAIYEDTKAQFETEEEFYRIIDQLPYTVEVFRDILVRALLQQYYIDHEFSDISVSREDVENFYAILQEQMEDPPPLADIRSDIQNRLLQTEIQIALNDRLNQLLKDAEIEQKFPLE